ncbi:MAG: Fic family protein [Parcubacteria group bacterium GW2011_GWC1_43_61]|nr:MAG: Fic family protein [Parcubacteria group bacterium GW2011_GWC1_43_61]
MTDNFPEIKNSRPNDSSVGRVKENQQYIPLSEAGEFLGTSRDYMNVLVRRGKLRAIKLGRNWFTTNEWLAEYRKPPASVVDELKKQLALEKESSIEKSAFISPLKKSNFLPANLNRKKNQKFLKRPTNKSN